MHKSFFVETIIQKYCCNTPNFGSSKNLIIKDPKFRGNNNFLKCLVNGCVLVFLVMLCLVFVVITSLAIYPKTQPSYNMTSDNNVLINKTVHISSAIFCLKHILSPRCPVWPFQPYITADTAIQIDLHSAEVAQFTHTNRSFRRVCHGPSDDNMRGSR